MQGIVALARKHCAVHIEQAARIALERGIYTCKIIRKLVAGIAGANLADREKASAEFTQEHSLIRSPQDYALFFETHAAGNGRKPNTLQ
jgi:hypothetical protein